jgi:uncharacterized membrane-anchored protein YhcB (DUF1043 family)
MKKYSDKKDRLERFVRDNREEFDDLVPSDSLWSRIDEQLPATAVTATQSTRIKALFQEVSHLKLAWKMAAIIILVSGLGYLWVLNQSEEVPNGMVALQQTEHAGDIKKYKQTILEKREEIVKLAGKNPELYKDFSGDLEMLAQNYARLKSEFPNAPNKEALIEAMMQNLKFQVDLLNQQLEILENYNRINETYETDPTTVI